MRQNYPHYQAYFCEENIWQLAHQRQEEGAEVWFISNSDQHVAMAMQRSVELGRYVIWDYHVIYYSPKEGILDFDTRCSFPCEVNQYLELSFSTVKQEFSTEYQPSFRIVSAANYLDIFSSTREHMRNDKGEYVQQPPAWSCIGKGNSLPEIIDFNNRAYGEAATLSELYHHLDSKIKQ